MRYFPKNNPDGGGGMKVCFFAQDSSISTGASRSMVNLMCEIRKHGVDPIAIVRFRGTLEEELQKNNIRYYICDTVSLTDGVGENVSLSRKAAQHLKIIYNNATTFILSLKLRKENIDVVHINKVVGIGGAVLAKWLKVPYVWHIREFLMEDYHRKFSLEKYAYKLINQSQKVIAISKGVQDTWEKRIQRDIVCIYNGIELADADWRPHCIDPTEIRILFAGTIMEGKRQMDAVKAVHILTERGYNVHLLLIGECLSQEYQDEIRKYIAGNCLEAKVEFQVFAPDLRSIRNGYSIGVLCSEKEGFGRVTVETMEAGLLFIGSDSGGTSELVEDGFTGFLYPVGDVEVLADRIEFAVKHPKEVEEIQKRAYVYVRENFTIKRTAEKVAAVYGSIMDKNAGKNC